MFRTLMLRLKTLFRRRQLEQDLQDELTFHVAMREQKLREAGLADPRSAAHRKFGNATRIMEDCRELWSFATLEHIWSDIRIGVRSILKTRWSMVAITLSLSLGIGSTAAVFNLFDSFLFRPLQVPETSRVVRIAGLRVSGPDDLLISNRDFEDLRARSKSFEGIATYSPGQLPQIATHAGQPPRTAFAVLVSSEFFSALRFEPVVGRSFLSEEDQVPGRDAVAIISSGLWRREYGAKNDVVGKTIRVNSKEFTIIGVAPEAVDDINGFGKPEVCLPRMMDSHFGNGASLADRHARRLQLFARLKAGITLEQARDDIHRIAAQLQEEHPDANRGQQMTVHTQLGFKMANLPEAFIAAGLFFIIATLVLGIACSNVSNLLLSTVPARTREMAIRVAMGASRVRLMRQMLIESGLVSTGGALAGLILAALSARFITSIVLFANTPFKLDVHVDQRVAVFALAVGLASGVFSGLIPALRCSRSNLNNLLKSTTTQMTPSGRMLLPRVLVGLQMAVAVVVLMICGFSLEQLRLLQKADPGFRVENVLRIAAPPMVNGKSYRQSLERIRHLSGIQSAAAAYPEPLGVGNESTNVIIDGYAMPPDHASERIYSAVVSEGYFETLQIPILRGRPFDEHDSGGKPRVAIINEEMARKYWPNRDPLGGQIKTVGPSLGDNEALTLEVVGIARTAKYHNLSEEPTPFLYFPMKESFAGGTMLAVTTTDPASFASTIRREWQAMEPDTPLYDISTMSQSVRHDVLVFERLTAQIMTAVASIGLILSVLGLYAMIAYAASQRTHEIGIRMAIGGTRKQIQRLILAQGARLGSFGIVAGVGAAVLMQSMLGVFFKPTNSSAPDPFSPFIYFAVIALSLTVTLLAAYVPARRASIVDPNIALRCDN